jgi:hypothetical protein
VLEKHIEPWFPVVRLLPLEKSTLATSIKRCPCSDGSDRGEPSSAPLPGATPDFARQFQEAQDKRMLR